MQTHVVTMSSMLHHLTLMQSTLEFLVGSNRQGNHVKYQQQEDLQQVSAVDGGSRVEADMMAPQMSVAHLER